jgi:uncharacterized protein
MPGKAKLTERRRKHNDERLAKIHKEPDLFVRGVALFNAKYFFEAHEAWEEIWLKTAPPEKTFLQGLIQVTAAFHHHSRQNLRGTKSLLRAGLAKLEPFPDDHRGINIAELRKVGHKWLDVLDNGARKTRPKHPRLTKIAAKVTKKVATKD